MHDLRFDILLPKLGTPMYLTPISDVHLDSPDCDEVAYRRTMTERNKLKYHVFAGIGDYSNMILPGDEKRHRPCENKAKYANKDNMIDWMVRDHRKFARQYPWLWFGAGNHDLSVEKRHLTNPAYCIARGLKLPGWIKNTESPKNRTTPYGGYTGNIRLSFWDTGRNKEPRHSIDILWHHGAWGGQNKGIVGAHRWIAGNPLCRIYLCGHNHQSATDTFPISYVNRMGNRVYETSHLLFCGTYLRTAAAGRTTYSEVKGYAPVSIGSPLIRITPHRDRVDVSFSLGDC